MLPHSLILRHASFYNIIDMILHAMPFSRRCFLIPILISMNQNYHWHHQLFFSSVECRVNPDGYVGDVAPSEMTVAPLFWSFGQISWPCHCNPYSWSIPIPDLDIHLVYFLPSPLCQSGFFFDVNQCLFEVDFHFLFHSPFTTESRISDFFVCNG